MAIKPAPAKKKAVTRKPRVIGQKVEHVAEINLARRDEKGNLFTAVVDLGRGTVQVRQATTPITFRGAKEVHEGITDLIEYFTALAEYVENAPASVLVYDEDEEEGEATPAA